MGPDDWADFFDDDSSDSDSIEIDSDALEAWRQSEFEATDSRDSYTEEEERQAEAECEAENPPDATGFYFENDECSGKVIIRGKDVSIINDDDSVDQFVLRSGTQEEIREQLIHEWESRGFIVSSIRGDWEKEEKVQEDNSANDTAEHNKEEIRDDQDDINTLRIVEHIIENLEDEREEVEKAAYKMVSEGFMSEEEANEYRREQMEDIDKREKEVYKKYFGKRD